MLDPPWPFAVLAEVRGLLLAHGPRLKPLEAPVAAARGAAPVQLELDEERPVRAAPVHDAGGVPNMA